MFNETQKAIADISDTLQRHSFVLHTFTSLLINSDLKDFVGDDSPDTYIDSNIDKHDLKQGMKYIIELYLAHQKKLINDCMDSSFKGDSWFVNRARNVISEEESGVFASNELAINELVIAIAILDIVVNKKASAKDSCTEEAEELKALCLEKIGELKKG